jgi:hypothetical protein
MKMVERYHYLQCSAEYGLCVSLKRLFVFVCFLSSKINGFAGFDGLNLFSKLS